VRIVRYTIHLPIEIGEDSCRVILNPILDLDIPLNPLDSNDG